MMEQEKHDRLTAANWLNVVILSIAVGLVIGFSLWLWQRVAPNGDGGSSKGKAEIVTGNANRPAAVKGAMPVVLDKDLPETDRELEFFGDELAEASFHLHENEREPALQVLLKVEQQVRAKAADESDEHQQLLQKLLLQITPACADVEQNKISEAEQKIETMMNQLDLPND